LTIELLNAVEQNTMKLDARPLAICMRKVSSVDKAKKLVAMAMILEGSKN